MIHLPFGFPKSSALRKRQTHRLRTLRHQPTFEHLEDRCLLATTYTTPASLFPVNEMAYGPVGDIWFSRLQDDSITRIASDGTISQFGISPLGGQPTRLEVDANDNLWCTSASSAPANHLFEVTPAGAVTEISIFNTVFDHVSQDPVQPVAYLTQGHINEDNTGVLVALRADGSTTFYPLPTGVPVGPGKYWARPLSVAISPNETHTYYYPSAFWYTDANAIAEFGPEGEFDRFALPDPTDQAQSIALGGDGNLWFVESKSHVSPAGDAYYLADKIGKIAVDGTITEYDVKLAGFRLKIGPLVRGTDGSLWFDQVGVEEDGATPEPNTHRIGRINPDGTISHYIPPVSSAGGSTYTINAVSPSGVVADSPTFAPVAYTAQTSIVEVHPLSELTLVPTPNAAPVAVNDSYTVPTGNTLTVARPGVLGNDTDPNGDALRAIQLTSPSHGTLTLNLNGSLTYVPNAGYTGADSFTYQASDGLLQSGPATVSITVLPVGGDPPIPSQLGPFANTITHSKEHYTQFVTNAYQQYLARTPDAFGLNSWVTQMQGGLTDEQLEAGFIGSAEYIARHGGQGAGWVIGLYKDILGRIPAESEVNGWVNQLNTGVSPQTIALGFAAGREREQNRVRADYQTFLGRAPAQTEVDGWVNGFLHGLTNESLVAGFLSSSEYYNAVLKGKGNNLDWIKAATQDELQRAPTAAEINAALATLTPANLTAVANQITHSVDHYTQFVTSAYQTYLGRAPEATGLNSWVKAMQNGLSDEQLEAGFIGSAEYIAKHGGQGAGWVTGMYRDILGRTPSQSEVNGWVQTLNAGVKPQDIAYGFAASAEREGNRVRGDYQTFLGRTPAQAEVDGWVNAFLHGLTNEGLVAGLLGSLEYYNAAAKGKSDKADWVLSAVMDELQRSPTIDEFNSLEGMLQ